MTFAADETIASAASSNGFKHQYDELPNIPFPVTKKGQGVGGQLGRSNHLIVRTQS